MKFRLSFFLSLLLVLGGGCSFPAAYETFSFDELGFSVELPLAKEKVTTRYLVCDKEGGCDSDSTAFGAFYNEDNKETNFLSSADSEWSPSRGASLQDISGIEKRGERYFVLASKNFEYEIHPIRLEEDKGKKIIFFDAKKDFYKELADKDPANYANLPQIYAAVFNTKSSTFSTAILYFDTSTVPLESWDKILSSFTFY